MHGVPYYKFLINYQMQVIPIITRKELYSKDCLCWQTTSYIWSAM